MRFSDRRTAGRLLAARLEHLRRAHPIVLALPRGGVPVAFEIAHALRAPLDLLLVRKLGAPGHEELGIGAVVDGADPQVVLNEGLVRQSGASADYVRAEMQRQFAEIERRRDQYVGDRPPVAVEGRTVILVDDGIATGGTVRAALRALRKKHPSRLVLAVPVAPADTLERLRPDCDEVICLEQPEPFYAVGAHYQDFTQTADEEVIALLDEASRFPPAAKTRDT